MKPNNRPLMRLVLIVIISAVTSFCCGWLVRGSGGITKLLMPFDYSSINKCALRPTINTFDNSMIVHVRLFNPDRNAHEVHEIKWQIGNGGYDLVVLEPGKQFITVGGAPMSKKYIPTTWPSINQPYYSDEREW